MLETHDTLDDQITVDPGILGGRPVVMGTRVLVQVIVCGLAAGITVEEVCDQYRVTEEQVRAALAYAADTVANERVMVVG